MPVLSPHRSSASGLTGSYHRSSAASSYYSYTPRYSTYTSERYTSRTFSDTDGRKLLSRTASIAEDNLTSHYREEIRESSVRRDSYSRDSGIGSFRENSVLESSSRRSDRDSSLSRSDSGRPSALHVLESVADLRNRYSPANYVPAHLRNSSTKRAASSSNDLGRPPIDSKKVIDDVKNINNTSAAAASVVLRELSNNTNSTDNGIMCDRGDEDDNGNRPSVSEMRKRFDATTNATAVASKSNKPISNRTSPLHIEGTRVSENRFKKLDTPPPGSDGKKLRKPLENGTAKTTAVRKTTTVKKTTGLSTTNRNDKKVDATDGAVRRTKEDAARIESSNGVRGGSSVSPEPPSLPKKDAVIAAATVVRISNNHVNDFASYIPSKDFEKGDDAASQRETVAKVECNGDLEGLNSIAKPKKLNKDITTSPSRPTQRSQNAVGAISGVTSTTTGSSPSSTTTATKNSSSVSPSSQRNSTEREMYRSAASPVGQSGLNGLKNIGNTCFMNSVLQCLSNTKPLLQYVRNDGHVDDINTHVSNMKGALIKAFAQVIKELWSEDASDRVVNTASLKSQIQRFAPRFIGYAQQDAQEFLRYLLEGLHEDVNRVATKPTPIHTEIDEKLSDSEKASESWRRYLRRENSKIVDLFVGQLKSTLKCTHCGHCSVTFDPFWDLSLPIPHKIGSGMRLTQCLESFTREETLDGDEKPTCSKCKERRKCTKSFSIQKFPKILVIHLKRFSPTERFRGKLSVNVDFPLEGLDMSNYAAESNTQCRYNLYAISNHSGTTYSGHYTAYCRHPFSLSWHEYNDSRVSSISPKQVVSSEAYVLFYELVSLSDRPSHL